MNTMLDQPLSFKHIEHAIGHAAHLLPAQGPITVFIHHNTLHGLEHLPFEVAVRRASEIFGCKPYLAEDRFRMELAQGRILQQDISSVLMDDLGDEAEIFVGFLGTRFHLRRAMLRHPLHAVLPNQLEWVIAEEKSFDQFSPEAAGEKDRMVSSTRRWVTRIWSDLGSNSRRDSKNSESEQDFQKFQSSIEPLKKQFSFNKLASWNDSVWESFTLNWLWQICLQSIREFPLPDRTHDRWRHRDYLLRRTGIDTDLWVNEFLIRFGIVVADQGLSRWHLPQRERGWYGAFLDLYSTDQPLSDRWLRHLAAELRRIQELGLGPLESIEESLQLLGVAGDQLDTFIEQTFLALRGIAGMVWQMEIRADRIAHSMKSGSLTEFLAVRLILERLATEHALSVSDPGVQFPANQFPSSSTSGVRIPDLREVQEFCNGEPDPESVEQNVRCEAFTTFQLAQALGWLPESLLRLNTPNWHRLLEEIRSFDSTERQKIFHLAYELRYRQQALDAILTNIRTYNRKSRVLTPTRRIEVENHEHREQASESKPLFDVVVCIDEREESLRRHLEEIEPRCRTWGFAGFFAVAMYYCAADSFQYVPLCPVVIEPQHYVQETVTFDQTDIAQRRSSLRRIVGKTQRQLHSGSRSLLTGALTSVMGMVMTVPLVGRVLFPRLSASIREQFDHFHKVPTQTALRLERQTGGPPGPEEPNLGYSLDEMANIVERVMRDMGIKNSWSRLVIVLGHGSSTLNNPHESAYDCGACGGARGGPNARAFTQIANDPRVRLRLQQRGLEIPDTTWFVGGFHNTTNDRIQLLDLPRVPATHRADLKHAQAVLLQAVQRNAHERCRRFETADFNISVAKAYEHVLARSEDLSQVRPELGHATNALCIVGRRELTRGLFMDRRAFLHTYDPAKDDDKYSILARILGAVFPVCGGINLEYYFSHVDPEGYGCGTKLPHNIAALVGVMNGAASDLRTGLPWQMVEIHEPIRLLIVIESTPEAMLKIMNDNPQIGQMARGGWVQLVVVDAQKETMKWFHRGRFVEHVPQTDQLPQTTSSLSWYRGLRGHLDFAQLASEAPAEVKLEGDRR